MSKEVGAGGRSDIFLDSEKNQNKKTTLPFKTYHSKPTCLIPYSNYGFKGYCIIYCILKQGWKSAQPRDR